MGYVLVAGIAAATALSLAYVLLRLAERYQWHPEIRPRDVHQTPTPRLGGIAVFAGMTTGVIVASQLGYFDEVFATLVPSSRCLLLPGSSWLSG